MLAWSAERHPHRRAVGGARPMTFRQWDAYTNQLARALADLGVRRAHRVVLHMGNGTELASCYLAVQKLGAVAVPLSTRFGLAEVEHCLRDCSPALVVTDATTSDLSAQARAALPGPRRRRTPVTRTTRRRAAWPWRRSSRASPTGRSPSASSTAN